LYIPTHTEALGSGEAATMMPRGENTNRRCPIPLKASIKSTIAEHYCH